MERTGHTENVFNTVNKPNISDKNLYNNLQYNAGPGGGGGCILAKILFHYLNNTFHVDG